MVKGPAGSMIWLGMTVTTCCTTTYAVTLMFDIFADEVFKLMGANTDGPAKGGMAVMCNSNSLPSFTVFNSAWKDLLVHCRSDKVSGSSWLFTMRTTLVSLV